VDLPVEPVGEHPVVDPVVDPVDDTPAPPVGGDTDDAPPAPGDHDGGDDAAPAEPTEGAVDDGNPVPDMGGGIDLPVVETPVVDLSPDVVAAVSDPALSFPDVTSGLGDALGSAPTEVPDFHVSAPTADHATLLLPDAPDMPAMQVTDVDHAAGTVSAMPLGVPNAPEMTFPLSDVQAAQADSGFSAVSFAGGAGTGAVALTVAAVVARRLRKA
jgi:hypothetical protein